MKHFWDDDYDAMNEYETNITHHEKEKNTQNNDYELSSFHHEEDDADNDCDNDGNIKHFGE